MYCFIFEVILCLEAAAAETMATPQVELDQLVAEVDRGPVHPAVIPAPLLNVHP